MVLRPDARQSRSEHDPQWASAHPASPWRRERELPMVVGKSAGTGMCLLCEELWMPFEPPRQPNARAFVADAPQPEMADSPPQQQGPAGEPDVRQSS